MSHHQSPHTFAEVFQRYRFRSEIEHLAQLCDLMTAEGMIYDVSLYTRWKNGERFPDRKATIALINIFAKRGGIYSVDQANELLVAAGHAQLLQNEIIQINNHILNEGAEMDQNTHISSKHSAINFKPKRDIFIKTYRSLTMRGDVALIVYNFLLFSSYWIVNWIYGKGGIDTFLSLYFIVAIIGGVFIIQISRQLYTRNHYLGISMSMFALGLLAQAFGQTVFTWYVLFTNWSVPYPSISDLGFFCSLLFYTFAIYYLALSYGIKITLKIFISNKIPLIVCICLLIASYWMLLKNYTFQTNQIFKIFLDFGYPLVQLTNVALALQAFVKAKNIFGATKLILRILMIAIFCQYMADFIFVYQAHYHIWTADGLNDYIYLFTYSLTSASLLLLYNPHPKK